MKVDEFIALAQKVSEGKASPKEIELYNYYLKFDDKDLDIPLPAHIAKRGQLMKKQLHEAIHQDVQPKYGTLFLAKISIAASFLLLCGLGLFFYHTKNSVSKNTTLATTEKIVPGTNQGKLTLSNGMEVNLSDAKIGNIASINGLIVEKSTDGQLVFTSTPKANYTGATDQLNKIETPNGGQYQINLPDGSKVWLNAGSSLVFPNHFTHNERKVQLHGEAYFEIAHDKNKPFWVVTDKQSIKVLGTKFNVNAYSDQNHTITSLVEGSVSLHPQGNNTQVRLLKPGQRASLVGHHLTIEKYEVENDIAWKNGLFVFSNESIRAVMTKIARWYNIEINYRDNVTTDLYNGTISKFDKVENILSMLEKTNTVRFEIQGKTILVLPPQQK